MTSVLIRLRRGEARRWHLSMATLLRDAGAKVTVDWLQGRAGVSVGLDIARMIEKRLFSVEQSAAGRRIDASAFVAFTGPQVDPDVVLDCAGGIGAPPPAENVIQPMFEGGLDESALANALLAHRPPETAWRHAASGELLATARSALQSPHILTQGFDHALGRLASLAPKAVERLLRAERDRCVHPVSSHQIASLLTIGSHVSREIVNRLSSRLTGKTGDGRDWNVGWRKIDPEHGLLRTLSVGDGAFRWWPKDPSRFVADPFLFGHGGRTFVFVEELPYATWRGFISMFELDTEGNPGPLRPVLERPYHLSWPAVFEEDGAIWMMPETSANRTIELYRADPFPERWALDRVLIDNIDAADATYFRHGGLCWIAAATSSCGSSSWDSLSLFHAERLAGPWTPHPLNPVVTDPARARPAGWLRKTPVGLVRPAQDCVGGYGAALALNRIVHLDRETYEEEFLSRVAPPANWNARGLHTVNDAGGFEVVDAIV